MKPILFSSEMVRAILSGKKTQTRRILKCRNQEMIALAMNIEIGPRLGDRYKESIEEMVRVFNPYGKPGDLLWVRETWRIETYDVIRGGEGEILEKTPVYMYAADKQPHIVDLIARTGGWKPSIHMPKSACRLMLKIKDVRLESLNNILPQDAISEGVKTTNKVHFHTGNNLFYDYSGNNEDGLLFPESSFQTLWESIHGVGSWENNPWVWVIEFEKEPAK